MIAACPDLGKPMSPAPTAAIDTDDVHAAAAGDRRAFERLYRLHIGRIYGAVHRLAGYDHARAEDLTRRRLSVRGRSCPASATKARSAPGCTGSRSTWP